MGAHRTCNLHAHILGSNLRPVRTAVPESGLIDLGWAKPWYHQGYTKPQHVETLWRISFQMSDDNFMTTRVQSVPSLGPRRPDKHPSSRATVQSGYLCRLKEDPLSEVCHNESAHTLKSATSILREVIQSRMHPVQPVFMRAESQCVMRQSKQQKTINLVTCLSSCFPSPLILPACC